MVQTCQEIITEEGNREESERKQIYGVDQGIDGRTRLGERAIRRVNCIDVQEQEVRTDRDSWILTSKTLNLQWGTREQVNKRKNNNSNNNNNNNNNDNPIKR